MTKSPELTLYSRLYCHLCHEMEALVGPICEEFGASLTIVDVDADPVLEERFNELVPVLMHGETELARYRLNVPDFRAYMAEIR